MPFSVHLNSTYLPCGSETPDDDDAKMEAMPGHVQRRSDDRSNSVLSLLLQPPDPTATRQKRYKGENVRSFSRSFLMLMQYDDELTNSFRRCLESKRVCLSDVESIQHSLMQLHLISTPEKAGLCPSLSRHTPSLVLAGLPRFHFGWHLLPNESVSKANTK